MPSLGAVEVAHTHRLPPICLRATRAKHHARPLEIVGQTSLIGREQAAFRAQGESRGNRKALEADLGRKDCSQAHSHSLVSLEWTLERLAGHASVEAQSCRPSMGVRWVADRFARG